MSNFIKKMDVFGVKPVSRLHFGKEETHKSLCGGLCTVIIILTFLGIAVIQGLPIYYKQNPTVITKRNRISEDDEVNYH